MSRQELIDRIDKLIMDVKRDYKHGGKAARNAVWDSFYSLGLDDKLERPLARELVMHTFNIQPSYWYPRECKREEQEQGF